MRFRKRWHALFTPRHIHYPDGTDIKAFYIAPFGRVLLPVAIVLSLAVIGGLALR